MGSDHNHLFLVAWAHGAWRSPGRQEDHGMYIHMKHLGQQFPYRADPEDDTPCARMDNLKQELGNIKSQDMNKETNSPTPYI